jgi:hypothetical protein
VPNWASNTLTTTNPEIIAVLKDCRESANEDILGAFVPVPEPLRGLYNGFARLPDGTKVTLWTYGPGDEIIPVPAEQRAEWIELYGADNSYDWNIKNWGTKWDADGTRIEVAEDGSSASARFDTAWSPPLNWLATVVARHPEGETTLAFAEGGACYFGVVAYRDGRLTDQWDSENFWAAPLDDDDENGDPMDRLTDPCREHLEKYGLGTGG